MVVWSSPGECGVHSSPADVLPGTGLLRPVHVDPEQPWQERVAADRHHLPLYSIKDGGEAEEARRCLSSSDVVTGANVKLGL